METTFFILSLISFLIFIAYIAVTCGIFKMVPKTLSETFYMYSLKNKKLSFLFPVFILIIVATLLPSWIELSEGSNWQFLSFLCPASLLFVGAAPAFRSCDIESKVHTYAATLSGVFGILWVLLGLNIVGLPHWISWMILIGSMGLVVLIGYLTKTLKTCYGFHIEMVAFLATYISIILGWIVKIY